MVTVNEFLDPDVDIYYLVGKALRYVRVHNIFVLFFFLQRIVSRRKWEHLQIKKVKEGEKYSDNVKQG